LGPVPAALLSAQTLQRADSQSSTLPRSGITTSEAGHPDRDSSVNANRDSIDNDSDENKSPERTLRDDLCNAQIESPQGGHKWFIAVTDLIRIVTTESSLLELARCGVEFANDERRRGTAEKISKDAPRLFALLVRFKRGHQIMEFLEERIDDTHLPFVRSDKTAKSGSFKLCSKKSPDQPIKCMTGWDQARVYDFGRDQWSMFAPIFEYCDEIKHYELDYNCVLPWIEDHGPSKRAIQGGHGSVSRIEIHPAHQKVCGSINKMVRCPVPRQNQTLTVVSSDLSWL